MAEQEPDTERIEDLEVDEEAAEDVKGGRFPDVARPPSPPSGPVPIPYPN